MKVVSLATKGSIQIEGLAGLEGFPISKSDISETDLVLFDYDESFSHIIQNGKVALYALSEFSKNQHVDKIVFSLSNSQGNLQLLKDNLSATCKNNEIVLPHFEIFEQKESIQQEDEYPELSASLDCLLLRNASAKKKKPLNAKKQNRY